MDAELKQEFAQLRQEMDRRFEAVLNLISQVADRLDARFGEVNERFDKIDNRLERMDTRLAVMDTRLSGMDMNIAGFHKALDGQERFLSHLKSTQIAQQKAIDDIIARLSRPEPPDRK